MNKLEKIEKKRVEADQATVSTNINEKQFEPDHLLVESGGLENEPEASHVLEETENIAEAGRIEEELGNNLEVNRIKVVPEAGRQKAEPEKLEKKPEISPWLKDSEHVPEVGPLLTNSSPKDNDRNTDPVLNDLDNENQVAVERNETNATKTEAITENATEYTSDQKQASGETSRRDSDNEPVEELKTRADLNQQIEIVAMETSVQESAEQDFANVIKEVQTEEVHEANRTEKNINYQPQETNQDEKSISLTEFFGRKDENRAVRMKIYIVQARDTLSLIAEKYDVSVSQLLRTNHLESNQDVFEGQILYIPTNTHKIHSS